MLPSTSMAEVAGKAATAGGLPEGLLSWGQYLDLLRPAGELARITLEPESEQLRAELYRQLAMNLSSGYFMYFQSDARYPDWMPFLNSVFTLQPNPDDTYWLAHLDDKGTYRISGTRGTVHILSFVLTPHLMGGSDELAESLSKESAGKPAQPANNAGFHDVSELALGANGEFEVLLSRRRPDGYTGDWWPLEAGVSSIMVRQRSYDWGNERDARFAIERVDPIAPDAPLKPRMSAAEIDQRLRRLLGEYTARLSRMWLTYQKNVVDRGIVNRFEFTGLGGSLPVQVYWQGMYELGPEEALILETDMPKKQRYWNVQLNDALWNATEFIYRQSSLNGHQARLDADGRFRAVISLQDPGVWNWLDPAGYLEGMVIGRWYEADSHPMPTLTRVPFAKVREHLPPDTVMVTREQRAGQLRKRRIGGQLRRRW
ncbi:MAG: DUF1214 domain-containing protein [Gammaproteobacteria bacterium]|nr:DUF1214 domain-containing protein [Gammaproteobacteria bacterium]